MGSIRARKESGCLFLDFRFRNERCREQTALPDTSANRKRLTKLLEKIESEIERDSFDYRRYFPTSRNAARFEQSPMQDSLRSLAVVLGDGEVPVRQVDNAALFVPPTPLFKEFAETWYAEKEIEWRRSHKQRIRDDLSKVLIPHFGEQAVGQITKADILSFRALLTSAQN